MKRTIRFMLRYVLLPLMILAAIPTVMLIQDGYELYAQALEECPVQEMAERIESKPDYTPVEELPQIYLDAGDQCGRSPVLFPSGRGSACHRTGCVQ